MTVKIEYDSNVTSQPTSNNNDITIQMDYQQDLGQVVVYDKYSVGDIINFSGSNWRVIKNSTTDEDYVTLMKERILTKSELGDYAISKNGTKRDTMGYYWSETCNNSYYMYGTNSYTNSDSDTSGCEGHNDYAGSKVKEMLESRYLSTIGANNLKEIDGYKIRLITTEELHENLGWISLEQYATATDNSAVPTWVHQNFGEGNNNVHGYWTMSPSTSWTGGVGIIFGSNVNHYNGGLYYFDVASYEYGVRPVINLLKLSIE